MSKKKKKPRRIKKSITKPLKHEELNPTKELLRLEAFQAGNFQSNLKGLTDVLIVYDALFQYTVDLQPIFGKMLDTGDASAKHILVMLYQCMRRDLMKAMIGLCSGYLIDSTFHTRRIFETIAIFIELVKKPSAVDIYTDLGTKEALDNYVKNFMVFKLVQANLSTISVQAYKSLCVFVHPSFLVSGNADIESDGKYAMRFFDVRTEAAMPELRSTILQHLSMVFTAFMDIKLAFESDMDFDKSALNAANDKFQEVLATQATKMTEAGLLTANMAPRKK